MKNLAAFTAQAMAAPQWKYFNVRAASRRINELEGELGMELSPLVLNLTTANDRIRQLEIQKSARDKAAKPATPPASAKPVLKVVPAPVAPVAPATPSTAKPAAPSPAAPPAPAQPTPNQLRQILAVVGAPFGLDASEAELRETVNKELFQRHIQLPWMRSDDENSKLYKRMDQRFIHGLARTIQAQQVSAIERIVKKGK